MNSQIIKNPYDKQQIYEIIKISEIQYNLINTFPWTIFSWTNSQNEIIVDAVYGKMKKPFDLSSRDYIQFTKTTPNKFYLGTPVFGSTSKKWMIPGGVGVNYKGKYLGTMTIGFEIEILSKMLHEIIRNRKVTFTLVDFSNMPILYASSNSYGNCRDKICKINDKIIKIVNELKFSEEIKEKFVIEFLNKKQTKAILIKELDKYPYILLLEYDKNSLRKELVESYKTKVKIIIIFIIFLLSLILSYRLVFI